MTRHLPSMCVCVHIYTHTILQKLKEEGLFAWRAVKETKAFRGSDIWYGSWKISRICQVKRAGELFPEVGLAWAKALKWKKCWGNGEFSVTRVGDEKGNDCSYCW